MIFLVCIPSKMKIFADYLESINKHYSLTFVETLEGLSINPLDSIWLLQYLHNPENIDIYAKYPKQCVLLNFEQCSQGSHLQLMKTYDNELHVIDYSLGNMRYVQRPNYFYIPYMINPDEIFDYEKTKDVIILAPGKKRSAMANILGATYFGGWGIERDNELFRYKILVNIHAYNDRTVLEEIRVNRCIFNKMIVITEPCDNLSYYDFSKYVIECEYDTIPKMVESVLNNYESLHKIMFEHFDIIDICKSQKSQVDTVIKKLSSKNDSALSQAV